MIYAIGGEEKLVARSQACDFPPQVAILPEVITYPQMDLEQMKAMEADLLLTTDEIFSDQSIRILERQNIPVLLTKI